jgi:bifunctional DNA-binding transcriptional regulator/antitoxin component of YhaV-PrlF toxin-antitoxin module
MSGVSTLSSKYRIAIPRAVRESKGWRPGQRIAFVVKSSGVLMVSVPTREELVGIARGANLSGYRDRKDRF